MTLSDAEKAEIDEIIGGGYAEKVAEIFDVEMGKALKIVGLTGAGVGLYTAASMVLSDEARALGTSSEPYEGIFSENFYYTSGADVNLNGLRSPHPSDTWAGQGLDARFTPQYLGVSYTPPTHYAEYYQAWGTSNYVYRAGGQMQNNFSVIADASRYDPVSDSWESLPDMQSTRQQGATAVYNDVGYVMGGWDDSQTYLGSVEGFDEATGTWSTVTTLPTARRLLMASEVNGKLIAIGGEDSGGTVVGTVEIYDIANDTWTTGTSMPTAVWQAVAVPYNGKVYVVGGTDDQGNIIDNVQIYDVAADSWSSGAAYPGGSGIEDHVMGVDPNNGYIYVFGGYTAGSAHVVRASTWRYDIASDSWQERQSMRFGAAISAAKAPFVDGKFWVLAGYTIGSTMKVYKP